MQNVSDRRRGQSSQIRRRFHRYFWYRFWLPSRLLNRKRVKQIIIGKRPWFTIPATRGTMKCPKKYVKEGFFTWGHMHFILKCPKIEHFQFRFISRFKTSHVFFLWNAPIFYVQIFWNAPFFPFAEWDRKNGTFQKIRT